MDDQSNRMLNWSWSHQADEKYCDATEYPMPSDCNGVEPYVDSLRQLNKIVERILPETSSHVVALSKQKLDLTPSLKRHVTSDGLDSSGFAISKRQHVSRVVGVPPCESFGRKSVASSRARCSSTRDIVMPLRQERGNDEAFFTDDYSVDDKGQLSSHLREVGCSGDFDETNCSPNGRLSATGSKCSSQFAESVNPENGMCTEEKLGTTLFKEMHQSRTLSFSNLPVSKLVIKRATEVVYEKPETTVKIHSAVKKKEPNSLFGDNEQDSEEYSDDEDVRMAKSNHTERYSSADYQLDGASCNSDWSPTEDRLNVCEDTTGEEDRVTASDSSVRMVATSRKFTIGTDETSRLEQHHSVSKETHGLNEEDDLKSFTCPHCAYSASKKGQVRKHMSVHGIFLCAHCEFSCEQPEMLEEHRRVHHPGLCGRRLCKKCRILFPGNELESHERQCSGEKQRWACPECSKEFKFLSVMKAHVHKWHPRDCDGEFLPSTTSSTIQSISSESGEKGNDKQDLCEPESIDADRPMSAVNKPVPVVMPASTEKQYQCEECGKSFKTKWTLSNHAMLAHGANTPFCCDVDGCNGTPFRSDKELNCHRLAVHQLAPRKYECRHPGCTMQFAKYGHFKRHQSTHIGVVPSGENVNAAISSSELKFKCDWPSCTKAFIHQDYLQVHYRRHTDEKPYKCHHCEAAYRQKSGLKYHLDKVHNEKTIGRSVRKRKFAITSGVVEPGKGIEPGALSKDSADGPGVDEKPCGTFHSRPSTIGDSIKQKLRENAAAMKKSKEEQLAKVQMDQTKFSAPVEKIPFGSNDKVRGWSQCDDSESVKWSSNDLHSINGTTGEDMDSMGLDDDDWLLGNGTQFRKSVVSRLHKTEIMPRSESADQDLAGSTSDTEPLDEDLCEELRKLTDVINGAVMSPQDIDSRPAAYDSIDGVGSFIDPSSISGITIAGMVPSDSVLHSDSQNLQNESLHGGMNLSDGQMAFEQFPQSRGMFDVSAMQHGLYSRGSMIEDVDSVKGEPSPKEETILCGRSGMFAPTFGQNAANINCLPGEYYLGADNESQVECFSDNRIHYRNSIEATETFPTSRSNHSVSVDAIRDGAHRQTDIDMSGQVWPASNSSCWPPRAADSVSSMSGHSSVSNAHAPPVCSSAGPEFVDNLVTREDVCTGSEPNWSSAESDHRWVMRDGLFRGWCDPSQPQIDSHPVLESMSQSRQAILDYSSMSNMQWHMGRQGESAFTPSRLGNSHSAIAGFDVVGQLAASPSVSQTYCGTNLGSSPMSGRVHEHVGIPYHEGYMSGTPDGSWSNFYGRPGSTSSCGDGVYDQYLPNDTVYKSPLTPERFGLPPSVQPEGFSSRSYVDYNYTNVRPAHQSSGVYGFARNGYALPQVHVTSPWAADDFSDDRECRRSLPGVIDSNHHMPYQQNSVLYNVVPRYY